MNGDVPKPIDMRLIFFCVLLLSAILMQSCSRSFEAIDYGKDACGHCRMTIMDDRYAAEMITQKGKVYKFDDVICMIQFGQGQGDTEGSLFYVEDYLKKKDGALEVEEAVFLKSEFFSSPMNGNYAAFASAEDATRLKDSLGAERFKWSDIRR